MKRLCMVKYLFLLATSLMMGETQLMAALPIQTQTLSNGFQIVVVNNPSSQTVSVGLLYKVGTADDPREQVGLSHFLEHLMFKGTHDMPEDTYDKAIANIGGRHNAMTSFDWTMYTADVGAEHLEMIIRMEADRMQNLSFKEKEVESERGVVQEERRMRVENNPFGAAQEMILHALHPYHTYGTPPIGYPHHINAYTYESVFQHYRTWYAPNNAALVVVGPVGLDEVVKLAERYMGGIAKRDVPERKRVSNPIVEKTTQHITHYNKRNASTRLYSYHHGVTFGADQKRYYALMVLANMLGSHPVSAVYQEFVEDKNLCLSIGASFDEDYLDQGHFAIAAVLNEQQSVEKFKAAWKAYWQNLREKGPKSEEIERAKKATLMHTRFLSDNNNEMLIALTGLACGQTANDIAQTPERVEAVTEADIKEAIEYLGDAVLTVDLYPDTAG